MEAILAKDTHKIIQFNQVNLQILISKMKVMIIIWFFLALNAAQQQCPTNQVYNECGSACPETCASIQSNEPVTCTAQCVQGCFCQNPMVRDDNGNCVDPKSCPASNRCPKFHEVWTDCGSACVPTCKNLQPADVCTMQCIVGCVCQSGYVKNDRGDCVLPKDCSTVNQTCERNERWTTECVAPRWCQGPYCPNNPNPRMCKVACQPGGGCVCKNGFYRDNDAKCVRLIQCPKYTTTATP